MLGAVRVSRAQSQADDVLRSTLENARTVAERIVARQAALIDQDLVNKVSDTLTLAQLYLASNTATALELDLTAAASVGAQSRAGFGDASVTGRARVEGTLCDVVELGGLARVSGSKGAGAAAGRGEAQAWAEACLPRGITLTGDDLNAADEPSATEPSATEPAPQLRLPSSLRLALFPLRLRGSVGVNLTPSLAASRGAPAQQFSEASYGVSLEGFRLSLAESTRGFTFIFMSIGERWEWAGGIGEGDAGYEITADFGPARLYRVRGPEALADRAIDILAFRLHGVRFAAASGLLDVYPVRLSGLSLGSDELLLDASLGVVASGVSITSDNEVIDPDPRVAKLTTAGGKLGVSAGTRGHATGLHLTRGLETNTLGELTVETRGTLWSERDVRGAHVRLELFGGQAHHFFDRATSGREGFAGASVDLDYPLRDSLWLGVHGEGVASFRRDGALDGRIGESAYRALATLTWSRPLLSRAL